MEDAIPIIGIFAIFIIPCIAIAFIFYQRIRAKKEKDKLKAKLFEKALEKGEKLPENFFVEEEPKKKDSPLETGVICVAVGIGVAILFACFEPDDYLQAIGCGSIPFMVGIAYIVNHFIRKNIKNNEEPENK